MEARARKKGYRIRFFSCRKHRLDVLDAMLKDGELCRQVNLIAYRVAIIRYFQALYDAKSKTTERTRKFMLLGGPIIIFIQIEVKSINLILKYLKYFKLMDFIS